MSDAPEGMIPVEEFAKLKGITASKAIDMVRDGFYVGRKVGDDWYVDISEPTNSASKPIKIKAPLLFQMASQPMKLLLPTCKCLLFSW